MKENPLLELNDHLLTVRLPRGEEGEGRELNDHLLTVRDQHKGKRRGGGGVAGGQGWRNDSRGGGGGGRPWGP